MLSRVEFRRHLGVLEPGSHGTALWEFTGSHRLNREFYPGRSLVVPLNSRTSSALIPCITWETERRCLRPCRRAGGRPDELVSRAIPPPGIQRKPVSHPLGSPEWRCTTGGTIDCADLIPAWLAI